MIDTVILAIPREKIKTIDDSRYPKWQLHSSGKGFTKWVKNTIKEESDRGLSYIKLTGFQRNTGKNCFVNGVNIEFSVAKLIKQNNLNEVREQEFNLVINTLQKRLQDMGEIISTKDLEYATVSAFHPSKNIVLSDGYTASSITK